MKNRLTFVGLFFVDFLFKYLHIPNICSKFAADLRNLLLRFEKFVIRF